MTNFAPAEVFPPGEFVKDALEARGWTQEDLAFFMGRSLVTVNKIITGKQSITAQTAKELAETFGTSAEYWTNLEAAYRLQEAPSPDGAVARRVSLYAAAPIKEMQKRGWIGRSKNEAELVANVCRFYGVDTIDDVPRIRVAARQGAETTEAIAAAQNAWARRAKQLAAGAWAKPFLKSRMAEAIDQLRRLTEELGEVRHVPRVLGEAGVRLVVVQHLPRTRMDGAALSDDKGQPLVALSLRYKRLDSFWFTLFHEIAHIVAGDGEVGDADIEESGRDSEAEHRANKQAAAWLVPPEALSDFVLRTAPHYTARRIRGFARRMGVHPSIILGQLSHLGHLQWNQFTKLRSTDVRDAVRDTCVYDGWGKTGPTVAVGE